MRGPPSERALLGGTGGPAAPSRPSASAGPLWKSGGQGGAFLEGPSGRGCPLEGAGRGLIPAREQEGVEELLPGSP